MKSKRKWGKALWTQSVGAVGRMEETKPEKKPAPKRRGPVRKMSVGMARKMRRYAILRKQFLEVRWTCERCRARSAEHVHHKRGRVGALLTDWRYWMAVCHVCHAWIGDNPTTARQAGYVCAQGLWNRPDPEPCPPFNAQEGR